MILHRVVGICIIAMCMCTNLARAEVHTSEAEREFRQGLEDYDAKKFAEALVHFRASLALERRPKVWANIIYCLVKLNRDVNAITEYDAFIASEGMAMSPALHAKLEPYVLSMGRALGFGLLTIETSVPGTLFVDGKNLKETAPGIPRRIPAGQHVIRLEAVGMAPTERTVEVHAGERSRVALTARRPFHVEMRVGAFGGFTTAHEKLDDDCSVYCLPGLDVFVGARLTLPLKGAFVAEFGANYLHLRTVVNSDEWITSYGSHVSSVFALHGALAYLSTGMDVMRGPLRFQWRVGGGFVAGQHTERGTIGTIVQDSSATVADSVVLGVLRGNIGLSIMVHRMWFGCGLEGVMSLSTGPTTNDVPTFEVGPNETLVLTGPRRNVTSRMLGRLVVLSPELSMGWSF